MDGKRRADIFNEGETQREFIEILIEIEISTYIKSRRERAFANLFGKSTLQFFKWASSK